jgi:hypothetical protein
LPAGGCVLQFPTSYASVAHDPAVISLRDRLEPLADLAERLGTLAPEEAAGLRALTLAVASLDPDRIWELDALRDYLAADMDEATWRQWLRAYGRLEALPQPRCAEIRAGRAGGGSRPTATRALRRLSPSQRTTR